MIENIETLIALHEQGTMLKASSSLRVSQSTVSKRITALEHYFGYKLISRSGRNVILNPDAIKVIDKLAYLLAEVRSLASSEVSKNKACVIGVSESILSSWGPKYILPKFERLNFKVQLHCHRSPIVVNKVESGEYDIGVCAGIVNSLKSHISDGIHKEEMVLVSTNNFSKSEVYCIETTSSTWKSISKEVLRHPYSKYNYLESFFSIGQIIKSTNSTGILPIGVARVLSFKAKQIKSFRPKIYRPIQLVYKKSKLEIPWYNELINSFKD